MDIIVNFTTTDPDLIAVMQAWPDEDTTDGADIFVAEPGSYCGGGYTWLWKRFNDRAQAAADAGHSFIYSVTNKSIITSTLCGQCFDGFADEAGEVECPDCSHYEHAYYRYTVESGEVVSRESNMDTGDDNDDNDENETEEAPF